MPVKKERVIAFIDGFNLYFGMREAGFDYCRWLNVRKLVSSLLQPNQELAGVKYYTSRVSNNPDKQNRHSTGIIDSRLRLYSDKFFSIFTVVPPKDEQDEIVQYIKAQEEKINLFIQKKQRFIELLKEQRQNIINHAITKGINPNIKMKASGIDWLGEVPQHWEIGRAKNYSKIFVPERNKPELNEFNEGLPWITCEFMKSDNLLEDEIKYHVSESSMNEAGIRSLPKNSVIAPCVGSFDMAVVVPFECAINQQIQAYIPTKINAVYLQYSILISNSFFEKNATLTTLKYVDKDKFSCLPVLYPPIEEQKQIVEHIKTETVTIDTTIAKAEREIELIREYKEAMISDAVVGKRNSNFAN